MQPHEELAKILFQKICYILKFDDINFRIMQRKGSKTGSYTLGYINLKTRTITLDVYTPKTMKPKSVNGLIRVLAHEIAHIQKPPYRQRHRGKWIARQHYPQFYKQVERNIAKITRRTSS